MVTLQGGAKTEPFAAVSEFYSGYKFSYILAGYSLISVRKMSLFRYSRGARGAVRAPPPLRTHGDHNFFCSLGPCRRLKTCPQEKNCHLPCLLHQKSKTAYMHLKIVLLGGVI